MLDPLTSLNAHVNAIVSAGYAALTVFFVISGFVLARRYRAAPWTRPLLVRYAAARFGRIYPVYLLSLVILAPIIIETWRAGELGARSHVVALLTNHVLLFQGWVRPAVNWKTPAWSLSCEVFFYVCVPFVVRSVRVPSWPRVAAVAALAFAAPVVLRWTMEAPVPKALLYFGDFLAGVAAAGAYEWIAERRSRLSAIGPWFYLPGLACGVALLLLRESAEWSLSFDAATRLAATAIVIGLACGGGWLVRALSARRVLALGEASYAIYILHVPLLWWFERSTAYHRLPSVAAGVLFVGEVIALSLLVSRWLEKPANRVVRLLAERYAAAVRSDAQSSAKESGHATHLGRRNRARAAGGRLVHGARRADGSSEHAAGRRDHPRVAMG